MECVLCLSLESSSRCSALEHVHHLVEEGFEPQGTPLSSDSGLAFHRTHSLTCWREVVLNQWLQVL